MDEALKKLDVKTVAEAFWNMIYEIDGKLSEIEDMVCDNGYSDADVVDEIQLLRSKLV